MFPARQECCTVCSAAIFFFFAVSECLIYIYIYFKKEKDSRQNIPLDDLQDHWSRINCLEITTCRLEHQTHFALAGDDNLCASLYSSLFPLHFMSVRPHGHEIVSVGVGELFQCGERRKVCKVRGGGEDEERRCKRE